MNAAMNFEAVKASLGKAISNVLLFDDELHITFSDNTELMLRDEGQSCCEKRYTVCDDNLAEFVGAIFKGMQLLEATEAVDEENHHHEIQFLRISTSRGDIAVCTHNEHNGYYGGFVLKAKLI